MIRIEQLELAFFGHFTNKHFNFGERHPDTSDFHIIYGANEAGKTTFMEAYLRLLYGFLPRNEPYAFRHGRTNLHVSALLEFDGETRKFQRKSGGRNTLSDEMGNLLPEAALQAHLGGLTMDDYRKLLCIDDDSIDKGGEEIVHSRGDIGTLLFSAAAGISDLWQVLESVRMKAEGIHKTRGSKTQLALLKKEYKETVKQIKLLDIPAGKLGQLTKALTKAKSVEAATLNERHPLMAEVQNLGKILNALPLLERLDLSEEAVANLAQYPEHLEIDSQQIVDLQSERQLAQSEHDRLQKLQTELEEQLKQLPPDPVHAGLNTMVEDLGELHGRYLHAELELESHQEDLVAISEKMTTLVKARFHLDANPESLIVDTAVIKSLTHSLAERDEAIRLAKVESEVVAQLNSSIALEESKLQSLEKDKPEGEGLGDILEQFNAQALSGEFKAATAALRQATQKLEEALDVLSIKGMRFSELPDCSLMVEEAEELVERSQVLNSSLTTARERQQLDQQEFNALTLESQQLQSSGALASDEDTQALKQVREEAWILHKQLLTLETAEAFEPALHAVDQAMEGRLSNASDLARLREIHRQIPRVQGQLDSTAASIAATGDELKDIESRLCGVLQQAGIEAKLPPRAVLDWVRGFHQAASRHNELERLRKNNQPVADKVQRLKEALSVYIKREQASLDELLPAANTMLEVYKRHDQARQSSQADLASFQDKKNVALTRLDAAQSREAASSEEWQSLVLSSFSVVLDPEKLALSLDTLSELREYNVTQETLQKRCKQMLRDKALFTDKLQQIAHDSGLEQGETPESNFNRLKELAAQANKQVDERLHLQKKRDKAFADGIDTDKRLEAVKARSQALADMFHSSIPTGDLGELFAAVQNTQLAQQQRIRHEENLSTLRKTLGVATEEKARTMLAELDIESVQARLVEKESELTMVSDRCKEATEKRTRCEEQLMALTGDGEVAQLVEQRTTLELQMTEASLEYLKLNLGHRLAEQAINRYRDKHRSGMMEATETAFAQLTDGKYSTLQTQSQGKEETLLALDMNGSAKRADEMSKGTRFQLYLALRAAAYDQLAEQGTCLPFICDDIFETFDEDRTRAACRVMQRIGQRGQAIYLTHHRHVVELAREVCGDQVRVHDLQTGDVQ